MYTPTEVCGTEDKEMFHGKLKFSSVLDQCLRCDESIILHDFNAGSGTGSAGYEMYWPPMALVAGMTKALSF